MGLPNQGNQLRGNFGQDIMLRAGIHVMPTTAQVFYVGPQQTNDKGDLRSRSFATIDQALNACIAGRGDIVYVRPGYTENIGATGWANCKSNVKIVGLGDAQNRPQLTWNVAGSTLTGLAANMTLENLVLNLCPAAGSVTVTLGIDVTAAGVTISNCFIKVADSAARLVTTGIRLSAGADDFAFIGNQVWGIIAGTPTDTFLVNAAVNRLVMLGCKFDVALSATTEGLVTFAAAALGTLISNCSFDQLLASSTVGIKGFAGIGGVFEFLSIGIQAASGAATSITTPGNVKMEQCFGATPGKAGILIGTPST
jgi:hypothetical protein